MLAIRGRYLSSSLRFAVVDLETTGLYAATGDKIMEVGAVILEGEGARMRVKATAQAVVDPGCRIPREVAAITGMDDDTIQRYGTNRF